MDHATVSFPFDREKVVALQIYIYTDQSEFTVWGYPIRAQEEVSTEFCLHGFSCLLYVRGRELSSYSLS